MAEAPPDPPNKHTLAEQPNDHLNIIYGMLDCRSLYMGARVSKRLAGFAVSHLPRAAARADATLKNALLMYESHLPVPTSQLKITLALAVPGVTTLDIQRHYSLEVNEIQEVIKRCRGSLTNLSTSYSIPRTGEYAWTGCNRLTHLTFTGRWEDYPRLVELGDWPSSLRHLNVTKWRITDRFAECLAESCPTLETLRLGECNSLTDAGLASLAHIKSIRVLRLRCADKVTGHGMVELASLPHLSELILNSPLNIDSDALQEVVTKCPLKSLTLISMPHVLSASLVTDLYNLESLKLIEVDLDEYTVQLIAGTCKRLHTLSLAYSARRDRGNPGFAHLSNLIELRDLDLGHTDATDSDVIAILRACRKLERASLFTRVTKAVLPYMEALTKLVTFDITLYQWLLDEDDMDRVKRLRERGPDARVAIIQ